MCSHSGDMARSLFKLAAIKAELGETDQAKEDYERSIAIGESLVETTEIPKYSRILADFSMLILVSR